MSIIGTTSWGLGLLCLAAGAGLAAERPTAPKLEHLPLRDNVSQYGITWSFDQKARVGQFITADYYVVGPVTIASISPAPAAGRNGSMLNPVPSEHHGYDDRATSGYKAHMATKLPVAMRPGDSLVSTVSHQDNQRHKHVYPHFEKTGSPLKTAAVLTCLEAPVPADTFRPSYCGHPKKLYRYSNLDLELLPAVEPTEGMPDFQLYERVFQRPWLDHVYGWGSRDIHPTHNMPDYGREIGRAVGEGTLMLMTNVPLAQKKRLVIGIVQYGIDLWGVVQAGGKGWPPGGGFGHGRKWPMVLAGVLFQDEAMQKPKADFGEDMSTMFDNCWTGATVVYAGTGGIDPWTGKARMDNPGWPPAARQNWQPYEHLRPSEWLKGEKGWGGLHAEGYRRTCSSITWIGQALAARMMHAEKVWNHDAFFAYCDRWMTEDETKFLEEIRQKWGKDKFAWNGGHQGQCWEKWVCAMWARYRNSLPPAADGHKDPAAEQTWKQPQPIAWPKALWRQAEGVRP